jgi:hypothetical protein
VKEVHLGRGKDRRVLPLGTMLGEGAAGKVFSIPAMPGAAAKLYHGEEEARKHEAKVEAMIANPPDLPPALHNGKRFPQIAWPQAKLYDRTGKFIGFLMPEIDFARSSSLVNLLQKNSRRVEKLSEYYGYRVLVARNLASVFAELNRAGHHMIDMKPANLRFYPSVSWMAVVDTDGFSIAGNHGRIPADQLSDEYIAPENWKRPVRELGVEQDLFALAVIIFQLLDNGVHPFAGGSVGTRGQATDLQARILDGLYPYAIKPRAGLVPSTASVHRMFKRGTRELFDQAFLPGGKRPSAVQWRDHLDQLMAQLVPCSAKPDEHVHFGAGCGFCQHETRVEAARNKPQPARRGAAKRDPRKVTKMPPQVPAVIPQRLRPMPMMSVPPVKIQLPPPRRRRKLLGWKAIAAGVIVLGGTAWATQGMWRPLFPEGGAAQAAEAELHLDVPEAEISDFKEPRDYLILPAGGHLSVPMYRGPGKAFPVVDRLALHDSVIGKGTTRGADGSAWVYVMRDSDGMSGFVPVTSLLERQASEPSPQQRAALDNTAIARRYRALLDASEGYERAYLSEQQKLWEDDRLRCAEDLDPPGCRKLVDTRRLGELDTWKEAERASKEARPEFNIAAMQREMP